MKNKPFYKLWWFWLIVIGILAGNVLVLIFVPDNYKSDWLTLISGWISGIATFIVGMIAYLQSKQYKVEDDRKESYVDVVAESVKIVDHLLPGNVIGRKCVPKDVGLMGSNRFLITLFAYNDNPIFDIRIDKILKNSEIIVNYDSIQPMQKGPYGRTYLSRDEFAQLTAEIPPNLIMNDDYTVVLSFKNQGGDVFTKNVIVSLRNNFVGCVAKYKQEKSVLSIT